MDEIVVLVRQGKGLARGTPAAYSFATEDR
jgi:hypothetical protein